MNMCCPKPYSTKGGMGVELLKREEVASEIIKTLKRNLPDHSVTCKMRLLQTPPQSLQFIRCMELSGADAVTVECRLPEEKAKDQVRHSHLKQLLLLSSSLPPPLSLPIIGNGDLFERQLFQPFLQYTGLSSSLFFLFFFFSLLLFFSLLTVLCVKGQVQ